jgi:hypothetical protein
MNNLQKKPTQSQNLFIILLFIVIFFVIIALMYYNVVKDYKILVDEVLPLFNNFEKKIPSEMIPFTPKLKLSLILWLYIDNNPENSHWFSNFTSDKYIINRDYSPAILYQPYNNSIKVILKTKDLRKNLEEENNNVYSSSNTYYDFTEKKQSIEVSDIKYQHWNQLVVVVDNRYVDIYLNAKLVKSALLDNVPIFNNNEIIIGKPKHNPNCFLGKLEYKPDIIPMTEINALYLRDKDNFIINSEIRNNINLEIKELRKKEYTNKIIEDETRKMNIEDPI